MTVVAVWLTQQGTSDVLLESVADSKVADGSFPLLGISAKVFSLPVISCSPVETGAYNDRYHFNPVGLAFSGSSLIGLNLYSTLSALTSQLIGRDHSAIPSLLGIAKHGPMFSISL